MKLYVKCSDDWVAVTPNSKDGVIPKEDVLSHLGIAGYDINELDWELDTDGIYWHCTSCGAIVGYLTFNNDYGTEKSI